MFLHILSVWLELTKIIVKTQKSLGQYGIYFLCTAFETFTYNHFQQLKDRVRHKEPERHHELIKVASLLLHAH